MVVHHLVNRQRLTQRYFYRWFYWHGISRAILYRTTGVHLLEPEGQITHASERHVLGVPTSLWRDAACASVSAARRRLLGKRREALEYELRVCFWAGVLRQRMFERSTVEVSARACVDWLTCLCSAGASAPATRDPREG